MIEYELHIINKLGLHARAAAKLVTLAGKFDCAVQLCKDERCVDGKSIMAVMMLAASKGTVLKLVCEGANEQDAQQAITQLMQNRFDESE